MGLGMIISLTGVILLMSGIICMISLIVRRPKEKRKMEQRMGERY